MEIVSSVIAVIPWALIPMIGLAMYWENRDRKKWNRKMDELVFGNKEGAS